MADLIDTAAGPLDPGKRYDLTLKHGDSDRVLENAQVRGFENIEKRLYEDGFTTGVETSTRYEATGKLGDTEEVTVGFLPENVASFKELK